MDYYIFSQGTKSSEYSLIIKNGQILSEDDTRRSCIKNLFEFTEKNGKVIKNKTFSAKILKSKNNVLIELWSINTDRVNRIVPVDLLISKSKNEKYSYLDVQNLYLLLSEENIKIDNNKLNSILSHLEKTLNNNKLKISILIFLIVLFVIITLKYLINEY
ncbi:hypothetical protein [Rhodonellum sp.]|uniref:hypothetical protein n=1 Tax=Rhodonellum sp. TaxID=2231180 RepID=UPI00272504DB|nr:hypothetical protein [Rhodonellum sp.]MDO9552941.1 hypothetical protein [Rhodonellum sp.]